MMVRQNFCEAIGYHFDDTCTFIRFGTKCFRSRQNVSIPVGTNCDLLVADLVLVCYENDFMKSLSQQIQTDIIEAFNSTLRCSDDLLKIYNAFCTNC